MVKDFRQKTEIEMKNFFIKLIAVLCFIVGMGLMMSAAEGGSIICGIVGLCIFAGLVPISKCDVFKDRR